MRASRTPASRALRARLPAAPEAGATLPELIVAAALLLGALGLTATVMGSLGAIQQVAVAEVDALKLQASADRVVRLVRSARAAGSEPAVTADGGAVRVRLAPEGADDPTWLRIGVRDGMLLVEAVGAGDTADVGILVAGLDPEASAVRAVDADGRPLGDGAEAELVVVDLVHGQTAASRTVRPGGGPG